jgi:hypothetical protein
MFQGGQLTPTQSSGASLREGAESPGKGGLLCKSQSSVPVEVMITVVIFNTFRHGRLRGLNCVEFGEHSIASSRSLAQVANSLS